MQSIDKFNPDYKKQIIDLTAPIAPHWRYPITVETVKSKDNGNIVNIRRFDMQSHWYTHIDAPLHYVNNGKTLDDFPLENLMGKAVILDISDVDANEEITVDHLQKAQKAIDGLPHCNIMLLRTSWAQKVDWNSREYWKTAPYLSDEAAVFLRELGPKVVGFDFPQDYDIRRATDIPENEIHYTTHIHLLAHSILMIEYLTNLWLIPSLVFDFIALPVGLQKADGAQVRAIAVI
ncbi:kynurenine formamidase [Synergistales bacterium]|nr:kynurenine formamidase [Synergistales bacterium]